MKRVISGCLLAFSLAMAAGCSDSPAPKDKVPEQVMPVDYEAQMKKAADANKPK